jgi:ariadne-1
MIERAKALLSVRTEEAEVLLHHFSYDIEAAATAWFEDIRKTREASGLIDPKIKRENSEVMISSGETRACEICFEDFPGDALTTAGCAHKFCVECWSGWIKSKVNDGLPVVDTRCPMCPVKVPESMIRNFLSDEDETKFDIFLRWSFLENNAKLRPCIGVDCECAIAVEQLPTDPLSVKCNCGAEFCFSCRSEPHAPVYDCEVAKKWLEKINCDGANSEWILANTKGCPKCRRPISKSGGCMHMGSRPVRLRKTMQQIQRRQNQRHSQAKTGKRFS